MPDEFCVPDGNDFSDTGPDIVDSDSFDATSDSSVDDLSDIMTDSVDTSAPVLDDDFYHATPNSDIPILQEDGSVASLEEVMAANAETDSGPLDEVEPYVATPNSDIPILQEDASVASLEEIMAANAETDSGPLDEVDPYVATPNSDIPILQEDGSVASLEEVMAADAETDSDSLDEVEPYVAMPNSDIPILQEDGSVASLEEIMTRNAEMDSSLDSASSDSADNGDVSLLTDETDTLGDVNVDTGNLSESVGEPIHMTQSDVEWYIENANDSESLRQMRDGIASGRIQVDADTEVPFDDSIDEASGPILTRDHNEQWEIGNHAIDDTIEAMRDDLRDKGMEDGPEMEAIVMTERARMQEELTRNINGDFSDPYQKPDFTELMQGNGVDTVDTDVYSRIGRCYEKGWGTAQDLKKAVDAYTTGANLNSAGCHYYLALAYENGTGVVQDEQKAIQHYKIATDLGDTDSMVEMGHRYRAGNGVEKDDVIATEYYRKAAEKDDSNGVYQLARAYYDGLGVEKDVPRSTQLWEKSAELGHWGAQFYTGINYLTGDGVEKDATPKTFTPHANACEHDCLAVCKKCPPRTC